MNDKNTITYLNERGLSLIEILLALGLVSLIYLAIPSAKDQEARKQLESAIDAFDRAFRFASNEAILRNTIVRLRIIMEKEPPEYSVEYGPTEKFVLPDYEDISKLSLKEQEKYAEVVEGVNRQFNKVPEFKDFNKPIEAPVRILGIGTSLYPTLQKDLEASIYLYPSGERDHAIIIIGTDDEIGVLEISPFTEKTVSKYYPVELVSGITLDDKLDQMSDQIYKEWDK